MKTYSFTFARGGSKGLPNKNILPLLGSPLISRAVDISKQSGVIDKCFVSTDCQIIADLAASSGAEIIMRPSELATDTAKEFDAWKHAVSWVVSKYGMFDKFVSLPCTAPLRSTEDILNCINALNDEVNIVLTMSPASRSPWFNMVKSNSTGLLEKVIHSPSITRRQDAPTCYDLTTVAYVSTPSYVLNSSSIWDGNVAGVIVPKERAIDIDDYYDFACAETLLRLKSSLNS